MPVSGDIYNIPAGVLTANGAALDAPTQHNAFVNDVKSAFDIVLPKVNSAVISATSIAALKALSVSLPSVSYAGYLWVPKVIASQSALVQAAITADTTNVNYAVSTVDGTRYWERSQTVRLTMEDLGALANGTDDGARVTAALYGRFGGQAAGMNMTFYEVHGTNGKNYTLTSTITVRNSRIRFIGNGATITLSGVANAFNFTQDGTGAYGGNEDGAVIGWKFAGGTGPVVTGIACNFINISENWFLNCASAIDINAVGAQIRHNYIRGCSSTGIILRSAVSAGGVTPGESQRCVVAENKIWVGTGIGLHCLYGGGHMIFSNDFEGNTGGEIYLQCSFGNQMIGNYLEWGNTVTAYVGIKMDSVAGANPVAARSTTENMIFMSAFGGGYSFDIDSTQNNAWIGINRLGTGNINIRAGSNGTVIEQQNGTPNITNNGAGTIIKHGLSWTGLKPISSTNVPVRNAPFFIDVWDANSTSGLTSIPVTLPIAEDDAAYQVRVDLCYVSGVPVTTSAIPSFPTTSGFTLNLNAAVPNTGGSNTHRLRIWINITR